MITTVVQTLLAGVLLLSTEANASPRVVRMPMAQKRNSSSALLKRTPFAISMQNFIPYGEYFVTASIGTPAQEIELIVDTGSSDLWVFGTGSCTSGSPCEGGTFDPSSSSTFADVPGGVGVFEIQYQTPGSGVKGDYFTDVLSVGGVKVTNQTMAVATRAAQVPSGIMGIGLAANEAAVSQGLGQYANFPDTLVAQGKIASKAYSLYLDDIATSTGTILWGGYDYDKFKGDLTMLPIQIDDQSGARTSFTVAWTSLGINTPKGDFGLSSDNFVYGAVLDTGTTLTYMPSALYQPLANYFNVETSGSGSNAITLVACNVAKSTPGQLIYGLGGADGVQIAVDFDELAVPIFSTKDGKQLKLRNGDLACQFGLADAGEGFSILFGQTFLRSAYVLYDLDNLQLGVAQTIFDATTTNVMEYNGNQTTGRIETDTQGPTVTYAMSAASAVPGNAGGYGSYLGSGYSSFGSISGYLPAMQTDSVSVITTKYNLASFTYPSDMYPTAFPTSIPAGPTGKVGTGANADGSPFSAGQSGSSGGNSGSGSGSGSGSSSDAGNEAPSISLGTATVVATFLTVFTAVLML